jgi:hypothetical protein
MRLREQDDRVPYGLSLSLRCIKPYRVKAALPHWARDAFYRPESR